MVHQNFYAIVLPIGSDFKKAHSKGSFKSIWSLKRDITRLRYKFKFRRRDETFLEVYEFIEMNLDQSGLIRKLERPLVKGEARRFSANLAPPPSCESPLKVPSASIGNSEKCNLQWRTQLELHPPGRSISIDSTVHLLHCSRMFLPVAENIKGGLDTGLESELVQEKDLPMLILFPMV
jgi:hypothetical protein